MNKGMTARIAVGGTLLMALALPGAHAQTPAGNHFIVWQATDPSAAPPPTPPDMTPPTPGATTPGGTASGTGEGGTETLPAKKSNRFQIGPEVGVYLPTSSKTRSEFGGSWLTIGLGLGSINQVKSQGQVAFDLQVLYQSKNGNHVFLAPVGVSYRTAVSQSGGNTVYVGAAADLYLADLRAQDYDVHSGLRTGFGGSVLAGVNFGDSAFLEARYLAVSQIKSFDLSGLDLTAGYRF